MPRENVAQVIEDFKQLSAVTSQANGSVLALAVAVMDMETLVRDIKDEVMAAVHKDMEG